MDGSNVLGLYSIFDQVAGDYGPPFLARNQAAALRSARSLVVDSKSDPQDYRLVHLGYFDTLKGELRSEMPTMVGLMEVVHAG